MAILYQSCKQRARSPFTANGRRYSQPTLHLHLRCTLGPSLQTKHFRSRIAFAAELNACNVPSIELDCHKYWPIADVFVCVCVRELWMRLTIGSNIENEISSHIFMNSTQNIWNLFSFCSFAGFLSNGNFHGITFRRRSVLSPCFR